MYAFFTSGLKPAEPIVWTVQGVAEDPKPPKDDEANDARLPEPTEPQAEAADDPKTDAVPTEEGS